MYKIMFLFCFLNLMPAGITVIIYSVLKLLTGFDIAAFIAWKLIVANAIIAESKPAIKNTHHEIFVR